MHGNHQLTLEEDSSKDGVANPAIELNDPIFGGIFLKCELVIPMHGWMVAGRADRNS